MTIKNKLTMGMGVIVVSILINTLMNTINLNSIKQLSEQTAQESVPFAILASDAKYQSCQIQQFVTDSSLTKDAEVMKEAQNAHTTFLNDMNKFEEMFKNENDTKGLADIQAMKEDATHLLETGKKMAEAYKIDQASGDKIMEELDKATMVLVANVEKLQKSQVDEAVTNSSATMDKAVYTLYLGLTFGIICLVFGVMIGVVLTNNITKALSQLQKGLSSFFSFLDRETNKIELISVNSNDEFGQMFIEINKNIKKTEMIISKDNELIAEAKVVMARVTNGWYSQYIEKSTPNQSLEDFKNNFNTMIRATRERFIRVDDL